MSGGGNDHHARGTDAGEEVAWQEYVRRQFGFFHDTLAVTKDKSCCCGDTRGTL